MKKWSVPIEMDIEASIEVNFRATGCNIPGTYDDPPECEDDREIMGMVLFMGDAVGIEIANLSNESLGKAINDAIDKLIYAYDIDDDIRNWEADNAGEEL